MLAPQTGNMGEVEEAAGAQERRGTATGCVTGTASTLAGGGNLRILTGRRRSCGFAFLVVGGVYAS